MQAVLVHDQGWDNQRALNYIHRSLGDYPTATSTAGGIRPGRWPPWSERIGGLGRFESAALTRQFWSKNRGLLTSSQGVKPSRLSYGQSRASSVPLEGFRPADKLTSTERQTHEAKLDRWRNATCARDALWGSQPRPGIRSQQAAGIDDEVDPEPNRSEGQVAATSLPGRSSAVETLTWNFQ